MKKLILTLCLALSLTACGDKASDTSKEENKQIIKIGATLPLSGNEAHMGAAAQHALQMVLEKWQNKDTKYTYEIFYENDMLKLDQAALNTQRFIGFNKVRAVISMLGVVDRVVDEIANQHKVISLSCSYGKNKLPEYGINMAPQNEEIYKAALKELKRRNIKKVALAGSSSGVSEATLSYAAEHLPQDGIEVVANERYLIGETDYRLSIQKIEQKNPDSYLIFGVEPMNSQFAKQYYELTGKKNLASLGSFPNINPHYFSKLDGIWSVYLIGGTDEFEKAYEDEFGKHVEACTANLYDGLDILITAFETASLKDNELIPSNESVLSKVTELQNWNGAFGKMKIENNGIIKAEVETRIYHDEEWKKIEE